MDGFNFWVGRLFLSTYPDCLEIYLTCCTYHSLFLLLTSVLYILMNHSLLNHSPTKRHIHWLHLTHTHTHTLDGLFFRGAMAFCHLCLNRPVLSVSTSIAVILEVWHSDWCTGFNFHFPNH